MCKWRISYGFNPDKHWASEYPDQSGLSALGVVAGVYDDGFGGCFTDPANPSNDWDTFVANMFLGVMPLISDTLPNTQGGAWAADYAWDLN